jgi:hypothetical protein
MVHLSRESPFAQAADRSELPLGREIEDTAHEACASNGSTKRVWLRSYWQKTAPLKEADYSQALRASRGGKFLPNGSTKLRLSGIARVRPL